MSELWLHTSCCIGIYSNHMYLFPLLCLNQFNQTTIYVSMYKDYCFTILYSTPTQQPEMYTIESIYFVILCFSTISPFSCRHSLSCLTTYMVVIILLFNVLWEFLQHRGATQSTVECKVVFVVDKNNFDLHCIYEIYVLEKYNFCFLMQISNFQLAKVFTLKISALVPKITGTGVQ